MNNDAMLAACREMAPDFRIEEEDTPHGRIVAARCELGGKPFEFAVALGELPIAKVRRHVLDAAVARMRRLVPQRRI